MVGFLHKANDARYAVALCDYALGGSCARGWRRHVVQQSHHQSHAVFAAMNPPTRRMVAKICALATLVAAAAVVATLLLPDLTSSTRPSSWWLLPIVAIAYAVAERTVFHFEFRREAISFSLSEVPTAFALVYLAPGPAIAARIVGSIAIMSFRWRSRFYKQFLNAAVFALEMAIAYQVVRSAVGRWPGSSVALLVAIVPATALATIIGFLFVSIAIALVEGNTREQLLGELTFPHGSHPSMHLRRPPSSHRL